jgi:hypothetical protein
MDHVVYLDTKADELKNLLSGKKTMILRGATGRKLPYGRVSQGDVLYLLNNDGSGSILAKAEVKSVVNSDQLTPEDSLKMISANQDRLCLSDAQYKRWGGKRYIVLIEVENVKEIHPFAVDRSNYGNMDDWLLVGDINKAKVPTNP